MLGSNEVHVWQIRPDKLICHLPKMIELLCPEEQARAARFHFECDYEQFVLSRSILRLLLARYMGSQPEEITFSYSPYGKPFLSGSSTLQFNLSHTEGITVYAFTHNRKVGIDVELLRDLSNLDQIAMQIFGPEELSTYGASSINNRQRCFFNGWTRKEAFIKACGEGWSRSPKTFTVSLATDKPASLLHIDSTSTIVGYWELYDLALTPSYAAALAVEGAPLQVSLKTWPDDIDLL